MLRWVQNGKVVECFWKISGRANQPKLDMDPHGPLRVAAPRSLITEELPGFHWDILRAEREFLHDEGFSPVGGGHAAVECPDFFAGFQWVIMFDNDPIRPTFRPPEQPIRHGVNWDLTIISLSKEHQAVILPFHPQ